MAEYTNGNDGVNDGAEPDTTRAASMGETGQVPLLEPASSPVDRARAAAGGRLEETARRVRELGDRAAQRNRMLERARPLANDAAERLDGAARYVRERDLEEVRGDLEGTVRRHPLASVALAFLAGYAVRRIF